MPDGIGSLYPQPQQNPLNDPLRMIGVMRDLQDYQIRQQQAPALSQIPGVELQRQQAALRQSIYNDVAPQIAQAVAGANTPGDIDSAFSNMAAKYGGNPMVSEILANLHSTRFGGSMAENKRQAGLLASSFVPPGAQTTVLGANAQPTIVPTAAIGGQPVAAGAGGPDQATFYKDLDRSSSILENTRSLTTALPMIEQLSHENFGTGSAQYAKLQSFLSTIGAIKPEDTNLPLREQVNKYLHRYMSGGVGADRSDAGLLNSSISNPSLDLTQPAAVDLVKDQVARDRMDAARPHAFLAEHPEAQDSLAGYSRYRSTYMLNNDPEPFKADLINKKERAAIDALPDSNPVKQRYRRTYGLAKQLGIIVPRPYAPTAP